ncbi:MAG: DUF3015 family protein [Nevskiales bacterium]
MFKKTAIAALLVLAPVGAALADKDVGCGVGTQIWAGQSGVIPKVLAATTNGTLGNQTFGITTGTLGCSSDGVITAANRLPMFAGANLDQLSAEMAAGQGEALEAMAELYGVQEADKQAFYSMTQQNYATIFSSETVSAGEVLASVDSLMKADARLARYVA